MRQSSLRRAGNQHSVRRAAAASAALWDGNDWKLFIVLRLFELCACASVLAFDLDMMRPSEDSHASAFTSDAWCWFDAHLIYQPNNITTTPPWIAVSGFN